MKKEISMEEIYEKARRFEAWANDPVRKGAIAVCAKVGNEAMNDPTIPWEAPFMAIDIACAGQILFGEYDNTKVAQPVFVDAVLKVAEGYPELADAPGFVKRFRQYAKTHSFTERLYKEGAAVKTLAHVRPKFVECPTCVAKPGSPTLCRECLERRELYSLLSGKHVCRVCQGVPDPECSEHGR